MEVALKLKTRRVYRRAGVDVGEKTGLCKEGSVHSVVGRGWPG